MFVRLREEREKERKKAPSREGPTSDREEHITLDGKTVLETEICM